MKERCPHCGILLQRGEADYFIGAYTLNLVAVEILLALAFLAVVVATWPNPPWDALQYGGVVLSILGAVLCYPFAKTTWFAVDLIFRPPNREDFITRVK
jgi:prepilin signal peptidase PulO-like enzyme (type II secretory pathway)